MNLPNTSALPPALLQAYCETRYWVNAALPEQAAFALQIDEVSKPLAALHKKFAVDCSAFVTACNPLGESLSDSENAIRQESLLKVAKARSLSWLEGIGQHPNNEWPGERGVLIFGLSLAAAKVLAQDFEQNAFVWSGADAKPQLVLLR